MKKISKQQVIEIIQKRLNTLYLKTKETLDEHNKCVYDSKIDELKAVRGIIRKIK